MSAQISLLLVFVLIAVSSCGTLNDFTSSPYSLMLDGKVHLKWSFNRRLIKFTVTAPTTGWIGLGFSPSGSMKGADLAFMWMKDGKAYGLDMYAESNTLPKLDTTQDIIMVRGRENGTHTKMIFKRYLETCDEMHDVKITGHTMRLIYAYGLRDPTDDKPDSSDYHWWNRGTKSVNLLDKKLKKQVNTADNGDLKSFPLKTTSITLPPKETYYKASYVEFPDLDSKQHIVQINVLIKPGNERYVHHVMVNLCPPEIRPEQVMQINETDAFMPVNMLYSSLCPNIFYIWAVGMTDFILPSNVGYPIGETGKSQVAKITVHYNNPDLQEGVIDDSGFEIIYTSKLRKYDAGSWLVGYDTTWPSLVIPPEVPNFITQGHCPNECIQKSINDAGLPYVNVIAGLLHTHLLGAKLIVRHYRNGVELPPLAQDLTYDFNFQETRMYSNEIRVYPEDHLTLECHYDSSERYQSTFGGYGTRDEMCLTNLIYYPRTSMSTCTSSLNFAEISHLIGVNVTTVKLGTVPDTTITWTEESKEKYQSDLLKLPVQYYCKSKTGKLVDRKKLFDVPSVKSEYKEVVTTRCVSSKDGSP